MTELKNGTHGRTFDDWFSLRPVLLSLLGVLKTHGLQNPGSNLSKIIVWSGN